MNALADFLSSRTLARDAAAIAASALLALLYARGGAGWMLGFVALVPWLRSLDAPASLARTLLGAWAMTVAYTLAVFAWFGGAIDEFTQWARVPGSRCCSSRHRCSSRRSSHSRSPVGWPRAATAAR